MRFFFKNAGGGVYEYSSELEREQFGFSDLVRMTPEEVDVHLNPSTTYKQALDALNTTYQTDIAKLNNAFALTLLADGPTESAKMAAIRTQYETRKTQHAANIVTLKLEYGV